MPPDTRLYLDLEPNTSAPETTREVLTAVLDAAPVASVLIRASRDADLDAGMARDLIAIAQKRNVPALVSAGSMQAKELQADGIHLRWAPDIASQLKEARRVAPAGSIVGADAGRSRHDARPARPTRPRAAADRSHRVVERSFRVALSRLRRRRR